MTKKKLDELGDFVRQALAQRPKRKQKFPKRKLTKKELHKKILF